MVWKRPTHRLVDGERVEGVWCHVWVKGHSGYYVDDLFAYADGSLRCGEAFDLRGLRQRLESGRIVLHDPERPAPERPAPTPRWSARYPEPLTNQGFLGEVADEIEASNGRPTSSDRSWETIRRYQSDPAEDDRVQTRPYQMTPTAPPFTSRTTTSFSSRLFSRVKRPLLPMSVRWPEALNRPSKWQLISTMPTCRSIPQACVPCRRLVDVSARSRCPWYSPQRRYWP